MTSQINRRHAIGIVASAAGGGLINTPPADARDATLTAVRLRCEWREAPLGIDTLTPRFCWELQGGPDRGARAAQARVTIASSLDQLTARHGDVWDSGPLRNSQPWARVERPLMLGSHQTYHWSVAITDETGATAWSAPSHFITGLLSRQDWTAQWISAGPEFPPRPPHVRGFDRAPPVDPAQTVLPLLRKRFDLAARPQRAIVSIAGLGHGDLTINGRLATPALLEPGWTEYARTILYATYDVSDLLRTGENMLGVMLGNGMFNVERKADRKSKFVETYGRPRLLLQLSLDFPDGTRRSIVSDDTWQVREGPILFSSIFGGEDVDARRAQPDWNLSRSSNEGWRAAHVATTPGGTLKAQGTPSILVHRTFEPVRVTEPKPGVFVYDLGTNFSGRPALTVRGPAGATVRLIPAEVLAEDGTYWQRSFNAGPGRMVEYNYTLAGAGEEIFKPQFNYHGFRYLQVEGAAPAESGRSDLPQIISVSGEFMHADLPLVGAFDCSKALFVDTHRLIERAVVSNAFSVLTDCPHREKLGWLEQTHLNAETIAYNRDAATLYEKLIGDIVDTQKPDGMVPGIAPEYMEFRLPDGADEPARNSPEWGAAVVLSPWAAYRFYGDAKVLADGYAAMQLYLDYLASRARDGIVEFGLGDWYDVGPGPLGASQLTSLGLTGTATWYQALVTMAKIARVLVRPEAEAAEYERRANVVRASFNARFFNPADGSYDRGSQTANAMPLSLGMVPAGREADVLAALVRAVRASANGVTAGDIGFYYVVRALTEYGRDDVMFDMMSVTDRPSYGYQLAQGATALAESWSADPTKSLNHFMLGHGEGWLFGSLAGIRVDFAAAPARVLTIAPRPVGDVAHAAASVRTMFGPVRSSWRRRGATIALDVEIPPGATARVVLPTLAPERARENGVRPARARGVRAAEPVEGGLEMIVQAGIYRFTAPFEPL